MVGRCLSIRDVCFLQIMRTNQRRSTATGGTYLSRAVLRQLIGRLSSGGDREGSSDGDDHSGAESLVVCSLAWHGHVDVPSYMT